MAAGRKKGSSKQIDIQDLHVFIYPSLIQDKINLFNKKWKMLGNGFFKWPKSYIVFVVCASQNSLSEKPEKKFK